jgi:hypothetical protein
MHFLWNYEAFDFFIFFVGAGWVRRRGFCPAN